MSIGIRPPTERQRERLQYMLMLRQIEAQSSRLRAAYGRLEAAVTAAANVSPDTLILDWLEAELTSLNHRGGDADAVGPNLMKQAVALCAALNV